MNDIRLTWNLFAAPVASLILAGVAAGALASLAHLEVMGRNVDAQPLEWLAVALPLATLGWIAVRYVSYVRWVLGRGPRCMRCDGPLGGVRKGRYGPHRRFFACSANERDCWA